MEPSRRGSLRATLYDRLSTALPDERFVFMNHGYLEPGEDLAQLGVAPPFAWSANLVRRMVRGVALRDQLAVDVGCGRGGASAWLVEHGGCRHVVGLDFNAGNVAFCRRVHRDPRLSFCRADAHDLPLADGSVDLVFNLESSHCYPDLPGFFAAVHRALAAGGTFCYADAIERMADGSALEARTALLEKSGFAVVEAADISRQVAGALFAGFEAQARFFFAAIERNRREEELLLRTLKGVTFAPFVGYVTGKLSYGLWRLSHR